MSWYDVALQNYYRQKELQQEAVQRAFANVGQSIGQFGQNNIANQIGARMANSGAYAPRAGLVNIGVGNTMTAGTSPGTYSFNGGPSVSTIGTAPARFSGGVPALQAAIEMQKNQQAQQTATVEQALKRAQTGEAIARTGAMPFHTQAELQRSQNTSPQAKANTAAEKEAEKNADTIPRIQKDFEDIYGTGQPGQATRMAFQAVQANMRQGTPFNRGSIVNGQWIGDPNGPDISFNPSTTNYKTPPDESEAMPYAPIGALQPFLDRFKNVIGSPTGRYVPPAQARPPGQVAPSGNPAVANPAAAPQNPQVLPPSANMQSDYFRQPGQASGSGYGPVQPTGQEPVRVNSREEALALPPGTSFIDPFGVTRTRP